MKQNHSIIGYSAAALFAVGLMAQAGSVFDDFESYALGSNIHGQDSWKGWDNVASAGGTISSAFAASGSQSVSVSGASDLVRTFSGIENGQYTVSLKQYVPSTSSGTSYLILLNRYQDLGPYDWSVQIQGQIDLGKIVSDFGETSVNMVKDAWVEYRFDIDLFSNTVTEYYNGSVLSTHEWRDMSSADGRDALQALDLFANSAGPVYYDDLSVQLIPEPGTIALLALGGLGVILRRRLQQADSGLQ